MIAETPLLLSARPTLALKQQNGIKTQLLSLFRQLTKRVTNKTALNRPNRSGLDQL